MTRTAELMCAFGLLVLGCGSGRFTTEVLPVFPRESLPDYSAIDPERMEERRDLDALRQMTAGFLQFERAQAAGWSTPITGCMSDPEGGMGYHYANPKLLDATVRADQPELLMYEPELDGEMRLVGVEYMVPVAMWHELRPPRLFGQDFALNGPFQVWALHVWAWETNPRGMYHDWNPRVSCEK